MTSKVINLISLPLTLLILGPVIGFSADSNASGAIKELVIEGGGQRVKLSGKITFVATRSGHKEIYVCNADGSKIQRITSDSGLNVSPAISPDSTQIIHTGYRSGFADIYKLHIKSGNRQRIINAPGTNSGAVFSPDGNSIALTMSFVGNPEIFVADIGNSRKVKRITTTSGVETSPTWSADGKSIAYSSDAGGRPLIYITPSAGGPPRKLAVSYNHCTEPSWSPDGKKMAFNVRKDGGYAVAVYNFSDRTTKLVGRGEDPSWGPDSVHLVYSTGNSLVITDTLGGATTPIVSRLGRISEPNWSRR